MLRPFLYQQTPLISRRALQRQITTGSRVKPTNNRTAPSETPAFRSKPAPPTTTSKTNTKSNGNPASTVSPPLPSKSYTGPASVSLKSLNAFAVSQSSAGGSRGRVPPKFRADSLSPEYRAKARRITLAMISAPIAIVLSYVLAMRVWGGKERLARPEKATGEGK